MGHQLMTAFAHQLGGTFNFASADRDGTLVTLRFPLRPVLARAPH
jgi:signal transduction histidine kinase